MKRLPVLLSVAVLAGSAMAIFLFAPVVLADDSGTGTTCTTCHSQRLDLTLNNGDKLPLFVDGQTLASSVHGNLPCTICHATVTDFPHPTLTADSLRAYEISQQATCGTCHATEYAEIKSGIHARVNYLLCTDCHTAHAVQDPKTGVFRTGTVALCESCHSNKGLMMQYGISTNVVNTYLQDFHGKTSALLAKQDPNAWIDAAICTDCHGVHNIQQVDSPNATVVKNNLVATCAKCHPGANANFPTAWLSHYEPSLSKTPLVYLARWFYWMMIPTVVLGLLVHITLDLKGLLKKGKD